MEAGDGQKQLKTCTVIVLHWQDGVRLIVKMEGHGQLHPWTVFPLCRTLKMFEAEIDKETGLLQKVVQLMVKVVKEFIPKTALEFALTHLASLFREFSSRKLKFGGAVCTYCTLRLTIPRGDCNTDFAVGGSLMVLLSSSIVTEGEPSLEQAITWA